MFVRTATRRNKDGSAVRYLQLVHNEWDPARKSAKMRVLHNFGRDGEDEPAARDEHGNRLPEGQGPGDGQQEAPFRAYGKSTSSPRPGGPSCAGSSRPSRA